jgi:hypothetical protein
MPSIACHTGKNGDGSSWSSCTKPSSVGDGRAMPFAGVMKMVT